MFGCFLFHVSGQLGRGISVDGGVVVGGGGGVGGPTYHGICLFFFWLRCLFNQKIFVANRRKLVPNGSIEKIRDQKRDQKPTLVWRSLSLPPG